jgi:hypothetical protein
MDITQANAYNTLRGYTDWIGSDAVKMAALVRAQDYITANYTIRDNLTATEQTRLDGAIYLLARDMLTSNTQTLRATAAVIKESKEGAGFKKAVEYADAPTDLYPYITILVAPLCVSATVATFAIARLVR